MEKAVSNKQKSNLVKRILSIFAWVILGLLFLFSLFGVIDRVSNYHFSFFGLRNYTILTESMSVDKDGSTKEYKIHQLQVGDLVVTNMTSYENINVGDVITYRNNSGIICHRVVEKYQTDNYKFLVTKGDANTTPDSPIEYKDVTGKVNSVVPKVGKVIQFVQSPYMLVALGFSGFFIFGAIFVYKYTEERKERKNKEQ